MYILKRSTFPLVIDTFQFLSKLFRYNAHGVRYILNNIPRNAMVALWGCMFGFIFMVDASSLNPFKPKSETIYADCTNLIIAMAEKKNDNTGMGTLFQFEYQFKRSWDHYFVFPSTFRFSTKKKPKLAMLDPGPDHLYKDSLLNPYCWRMERCTNENDPPVCISSSSESKQWNNTYWFLEKREKGPFLVQEEDKRLVKGGRYHFRIKCEVNETGDSCKNFDNCRIEGVVDANYQAYAKNNKWVYMKGNIYGLYYM